MYWLRAGALDSNPHSTTYNRVVSGKFVKLCLLSSCEKGDSSVYLAGGWEVSEVTCGKCLEP